MALTMIQRTEKFIALTQRMIALQEKKGNDYGEEKDGLYNLRKRGQSGVIARMSDKLSRLEMLEKKPPQVADESFDDTCIDLANYALLLLILREDEQMEALAK